MTTIDSNSALLIVDRFFDKLSSRLIRECAGLISSYISIIFNCCLTTGTFPDDWKLAKVIPAFKQGDGSDIDNYRPISVVSVV